MRRPQMPVSSSACEKEGNDGFYQHEMSTRTRMKMRVTMTTTMSSVGKEAKEGG